MHLATTGMVITVEHDHRASMDLEAREDEVDIGIRLVESQIGVAVEWGNNGRLVWVGQYCQ